MGRFRVDVEEVTAFDDGVLDLPPHAFSEDLLVNGEDVLSRDGIYRIDRVTAEAR